MQNNEDMLSFAVGIAKEAGKIITEYFYHANRSDVVAKDNGTPVTEADTQVNRLVIDRIRAKYPDHGILGEEQSHEQARRELWVCDPIDGTNAFIHGIPTALFSLAYVVDGVPQVAVMYDPFQDLAFTAVRGGGAFCNGQKIQVSAREALDGATIGSTASYHQIKERAAVCDWLTEQGASLLMAPGNVFRSGLVARGLMDAHIFPGRGAHDIAAAALIVPEAGGKVTDLDGNEQRYDRLIRGAIISNGHLHGQLVEAVKKLGSEQFLGY
ncbi:MAG TPA: inositol monophosphatase [Candidatus Saccharimonadales bacterium]|nr:inositol monophosphatase [Candidatus Saccharimonadales bacterium]